MGVDFQNVNINLSGASSLERLPRSIFFGDLTDVSISMKLSGASIELSGLETFPIATLPIPNIFGDSLTDFSMSIELSSASLSGSYYLDTQTLLHSNFFLDLKDVQNFNLSVNPSPETIKLRINLGNFSR